MPGSTIVGTSGQQFLLDGARSVARYKRSVDTCEYVASFAVLNTAGPGTPQQTLWVNLPVGGIGGFGPAGGSVYGYGTGGGGTAYGWFQGTMQINGGNGYIVRGPTGGHSDTAPLNIEAGTFSTGTYFPAPGNDTIGHDSINVNVRYQTAVNYG
jgi:hypothetical protein